MSRLRIVSQQAAALGLGLLLGPSPFGGAAEPAAVPAQEDIGQPPSGVAEPGFETRPLIPGTDLSREEVERIDQELLENILRIEDPAERSLALVDAARYKILTRDLETARRALDRAAESTTQIVDPKRRDLRLISTSRAFVSLAQEDINSAVSGAAGILSLEPELSIQERVDLLDRALEAFDRAAELAFRIEHIGYGPQTQYVVVEQQAQGGQSIGVIAFRDPGALGDQQGLVPRLRELAGRYIERAAEHAAAIRVPVWRDIALTAVTGSAATSNQFELGRRLSRSIPGLELRFDAIVTIAEAEARRGDPGVATGDYAEAARTLASIPIADLRGTLNDVLVESLIAAGRFPDARRCIVLYPDDVDRLEALGAVAESMGSRGLSDEAREWIRQEVAAENRSSLYRRVNDGVLSTLERYGGGNYPGGGGLRAY
ncbi:hypothetical protein [Tautonia plasticadhaerens]|uniref:Uncharacterized protein n=1 Tax=Tautonia plasticadhaerens TaxID=2527974 RepID=A0A518HC44_9BACT|nr:hypothetical protein [Tautonia plasticadhaerens]QDV38407.1 hypothetical protein ElP_63620 [Tautonia plasticadhaerens]